MNVRFFDGNWKHFSREMLMFLNSQICKVYK
jgi:hypothetical protein